MEFSFLAKSFEELDGTPSRLEKTKILSKLISKSEDLESVLLLSEGRVFPVWSQEKLNFSNKLVIKAISKAYGVSLDDVEAKFRESGDLGLVAKEMSSKKSQQTLFFAGDSDKLSVKQVFASFRKIATLEGENSTSHKIDEIVRLLKDADSLEAKYIVRIVIGDLRTGVSTGTLRDAILQSLFPEIIGLYDKDVSKVVSGSVYEFESVEKLSKDSLKGFSHIRAKSYEEARICYNFLSDSVQQAYDKINELSKIAVIIKEKGLRGVLDVSLEVMVPFRCMLMQKVGTVSEATEKIDLPFALEYKYDGFRVMAHKKGEVIKLYTRSLEDVTNQFPDVVLRIKENVLEDSVILDGEVLGVDSYGKFLPFQTISQRIKRKHNIHELVNKVPVVYATWDLLYLNGKSIIEKPLKERRELLINSIKQQDNFIVSEQLIINSAESGDVFYKKSLAVGNEGVVVKDLNSGYKPGNRVGCWLKIKPIMDPLDVVVTGAEWGEGKRANWLTSFLVAIKNPLDDSFLEIGKVGTGFKELETEDGVSFNQMTELLKEDIISEKGKVVKVNPKVVISVAYEEIQESSTYSSGYALRFPRIIGLREDLDLHEVDDLNKVKDYYSGQ